MSNYLYLSVILIPFVQILCMTIITDPLLLYKDQPRTVGCKSVLNIRSRSTTTPSSTHYEKADPRFFDAVVEPPAKPEEMIQSPKKVLIETSPKSSMYEAKGSDRSYNEIKALLAKVLEQIELIQKKSDSGLMTEKAYTGKIPTDRSESIENIAFPLTNFKSKKLKKENICGTPDVHNQNDTQHQQEDHQKQNGNQKQNEPQNEPPHNKSEPSHNKKSIKWGHWTDWSSCSVSCGKGRQIRWRHCTENCEEAETEMEEKTCQLPACAPKKMFGVLKV